jgi:predicted TIM-barrel fold metal-dependent hydrolase
VIDFHTHLHPPRLFAAIRRWFAERSEWDLSAQPSEPADVAAALRAAGVERFVFFSYAHKPGMAAELNAWLGRTARELGGAGIPLGTVHLDDPGYLDDLTALFEDGCAGIKIHEDVQRLALDDPRFTPVFAEIERRAGIVLAHVGPIPWQYPEGKGVDRVRHVLERHPDLKLVVAHMGTPDTSAYYALMPHYPNLYLDTTMLFAASTPIAGPGAKEAVAANFERVLYGTDFPNIPYAYGEERAGLEALGLPADQLEAILGGNARRLLGAYAHEEPGDGRTETL